jgi:hypothetical protein
MEYDKAFFAVIGVVVGFLLYALKDLLVHHIKNRKDAEYLSIQVACKLDRFVAGCAAVVADDGLYQGQPDQDGTSRVRVSAPTFEPELAKVEWKSVPAKLMYEVLMLPNKIEVASNWVEAAFENGIPPDYSEGFEERQYQYALLGLEAAELAGKLRRHANLPERQLGEMDDVSYINEKIRRSKSIE